MAGNIINANRKKLGQLPDLPDVSSAIEHFLQWTSIGKVQKVAVDGYVQEMPVFHHTKAVKTPLRPRELYIRPEGQRHWKWYNIFTLPSFIATLDDILLFNGDRFRIMEMEDYREYGFVRYGVIEDYDNAPEQITGNDTFSDPDSSET